jgi:hypothetical protein
MASARRADGPFQPSESTKRWTSMLLSAFGSDAWRQWLGAIRTALSAWTESPQVVRKRK